MEERSSGCVNAGLVKNGQRKKRPPAALRYLCVAAINSVGLSSVVGKKGEFDESCPVGPPSYTRVCVTPLGTHDARIGTRTSPNELVVRFISAHGEKTERTVGTHWRVPVDGRRRAIWHGPHDVVGVQPKRRQGTTIIYVCHGLGPQQSEVGQLLPLHPCASDVGNELGHPLLTPQQQPLPPLAWFPLLRPNIEHTKM